VQPLYLEALTWWNGCIAACSTSSRMNSTAAVARHQFGAGIAAYNIGDKN